MLIFFVCPNSIVLGVNFQYWSLFLPLFDLREQKFENRPKIWPQNYFFCQSRGYLKMCFEQSYCGCKNFRFKKKCFWGFFWFFKVARKSQFWPFLVKKCLFFENFQMKSQILAFFITKTPQKGVIRRLSEFPRVRKNFRFKKKIKATFFWIYLKISHFYL